MIYSERRKDLHAVVITRGCLPSLNSWRSLGWTNSGLTVSNHQKSSAMNTITLCCIESTRHPLKWLFDKSVKQVKQWRQHRHQYDSWVSELHFRSRFWSKMIIMTLFIIPWAQAASRACPLWSDRNFYSDTRWQTLWVDECCTSYLQWRGLPSGKYLVRQAESRVTSGHNSKNCWL